MVDGNIFLAAFKSFCHEPVPSVSPNIWEERLQLATDTREVQRNQLRFDMMSHIDGIEAKSVRCWINGEIIKETESKIQSNGRGVRRNQTRFNSTGNGDCAFTMQVLMSPGLLRETSGQS